MIWLLLQISSTPWIIDGEPAFTVKRLLLEMCVGGVGVLPSLCEFPLWFDFLFFFFVYSLSFQFLALVCFPPLYPHLVPPVYLPLLLPPLHHVHILRPLSLQTSICIFVCMHCSLSLVFVLVAFNSALPFGLWIFVCTLPATVYLWTDLVCMTFLICTSLCPLWGSLRSSKTQIPSCYTDMTSGHNFIVDINSK